MVNTITLATQYMLDTAKVMTPMISPGIIMKNNGIENTANKKPTIRASTPNMLNMINPIIL
jgi:hypothetical protein